MRPFNLVPAVLVLLASGCVVTHRVEPVPASAWTATEGSTRTSYPTQAARRDPPRRTVPDALTKDQVLALASNRDPQDAIAEIDRHPLAFALTKENLGWFEDRVAPPELVDYLKKRAAIDWDALAKAPPAEIQPTTESYAAPSYDSPSYGYDSTPAPQPTTVYVESPQPQTTVIYERDYVDPYPYYVGGVYVYGGCYRRGWLRPCYSGNYYYNRGYYPNTYYSNTYVNRANYNAYAPGPVAGLYPTRSTVVRTGNPTVTVQRGTVRSSVRVVSHR